MTNSTPNNAAARCSDQTETVTRLFGSIDVSAVFHEALDAYGRANLDVNTRCNEDSLQHAAVSVLDCTATALVIAAADYYCAHTLFDIFTALDKFNRDPVDENAPEMGRL